MLKTCHQLQKIRKNLNYPICIQVTFEVTDKKDSSFCFSLILNLINYIMTLNESIGRVPIDIVWAQTSVNVLEA